MKYEIPDKLIVQYDPHLKPQPNVSMEKVLQLDVALAALRVQLGHQMAFEMFKEEEALGEIVVLGGEVEGVLYVLDNDEEVLQLERAINKTLQTRFCKQLRQADVTYMRDDYLKHMESEKVDFSAIG